SAQSLSDIVKDSEGGRMPTRAEWQHRPPAGADASRGAPAPDAASSPAGALPATCTPPGMPARDDLVSVGPETSVATASGPAGAGGGARRRHGSRRAAAGPCLARGRGPSSGGGPGMLEALGLRPRPAVPCPPRRGSGEAGQPRKEGPVLDVLIAAWLTAATVRELPGQPPVVLAVGRTVPAAARWRDLARTVACRAF